MFNDGEELSGDFFKFRTTNLSESNKVSSIRCCDLRLIFDVVCADFFIAVVDQNEDVISTTFPKSSQSTSVATKFVPSRVIFDYAFCLWAKVNVYVIKPDFSFLRN